MNRSSSPDFAEEFNNLLTWLDSDRQRAGERYEQIRQQLISLFTWNQVSDPEELADETIMRVTQRLADIRDVYVGEPSLYFYGVARNVLFENLKQASEHQVVAEQEIDEDASKLDDCFRKCLAMLSTPQKELLLTYYRSKERKLDTRRDLAAKMGIAPPVLRVRVHRVRTRLHKCIEQCTKAGKNSVAQYE